MESIKAKRKLKILSISPISVWTMGGGAGAPSIPLAQEGLFKAGHEPYYLVLRKLHEKNLKQKEIYRGFHVRRFNMVGVFHFVPRVKYLAAFFTKLNWFWFCLFSFFAAFKLALRIKPDLILGYTYFGALPAFLIGKIFRIPYVFREVGTLDLYPTVKNFRGRLKYFNEVLAYKLPCAAMILTDDRTQTDKAAKLLGVADDRVYFWRNGIFKDNIPKLSRKEARRRLGLDEGTKVIVSPGRLAKQNNFSHLIDTIFALPSNIRIKCFIIGDGREKEQLSKRIEALGLSSRIIMTGRLSHDEVWVYILASDIVAALGSINPVIEGLTAGRCVIARDMGLVIHGETGLLLKKNDWSKLPEMMGEILSNDIRREQLAQTAKKWDDQNLWRWEERIENEVG